ncbi:MAG: DUF308 domain-containing protein [Clostridia bacterium]|nr:DUF308 domain-containing protein [Clostridia bacterium]
MENKMMSKETKTVILSAVLLVVGILFCFSASMGMAALSYIIGVCLIIAGVVSIINSAMKKQTILNYTGILGAAIIALGILFAESQLAMILFYFVPWLLIAVGALIIADAILKKISQNNNTVFITELIVGIIVLALGICLKFIPGFIEFSSVMLGIVLIIYAVYLLIMAFSKK